MDRLLFKNANIIDGTGKPAFLGDVLVEKGVVAQVGQGLAAEGAAELDAKGLALTPGFVDVHRHSDLVPYNAPDEGEELRQGITSHIGGNCGFSAVPSSAQNFEALWEYSRPIMGGIPRHLAEKNFAFLCGEVGKKPLYSNMGYLVGNGALRIAVKGFDASPVTAAEMDEIKALLRADLQAGAFGLSMGLMYVPENYYTTKELVQICRVVAEHNRLVTIHMRGEGNSLLQSIAEVLDIARQSGVAFHISHLKAAGKRNWNTVIPKALAMIEEARQNGVDITFDVYPYRAGSTALYTLLPPALQQGGIPSLLQHLRNKSTRAATAALLKEEQEDWDNLIASTGWQSVVVAGGNDTALNGRTIEDIAKERGVSSEECVFDLLLENDGDVPIVLYSMCEDDMQKVLCTPGAIVISDALYSEGGIPHPRRYGSQARLLCRYAGLMGLEAAVRSMTDLPARRFGIAGRGSIAPGNAADLLLLDLARLEDTASFENPAQYPKGIVKAFVAGREAFSEEKGLLGKYGSLLLAKGAPY